MTRLLFLSLLTLNCNLAATPECELEALRPPRIIIPELKLDFTDPRAPVICEVDQEECDDFGFFMSDLYKGEEE